jgi:hypothetical protein
LSFFKSIYTNVTFIKFVLTLFFSRRGRRGGQWGQREGVGGWVEDGGGGRVVEVEGGAKKNLPLSSSSRFSKNGQGEERGEGQPA